MDSDAPVARRKMLRLDIHKLEACCESAAAMARDSMSGDYPEIPYLDLVTGMIEMLSDGLGDDAGAEEIDWDRYRSFPQDAGRLEWRELVEFVNSVENDTHRAAMARLTDGCGAFRQVKDYLYHSGDLELKHAWRWFEIRKQRERIVAWLHTVGIEPDWGGDIFSPPPLTCVRRGMLEAARDFVLAARGLGGVIRIALAGSLTTDKRHPEEVILLVAVTDDMDLTPLAKLSRQLNGKVAGLGGSRGSAVFLTDPAGRYLGRVCPWKDCRRGIRQSCRADHCGRRQFLYDDLTEFQPDSALIVRPPLALFPDPGPSSPEMIVPADVAEVLIEAL